MMPSAKQIEEHEERGGRWLSIAPKQSPDLIDYDEVRYSVVRLTREGEAVCVHRGEAFYTIADDKRKRCADERAMMAMMEEHDWRPIDEAGNPMTLLAERDELKRALDNALQNNSNGLAKMREQADDIDNLTAERDQDRARVNQLENLLHELADEVRAQKRTAAYQRSHGRPATAGRRRIDIAKYLARAGIEVKP